MIKIEKGVPLPVHKSTRYPWHDLEIGDSFIISDRTRGSVSSLASYQGKRTGKTFRVSEDGDCFRVWRVS